VRERALGAVVCAAMLVTAWTESAHWLNAAVRAAERLATPRAVREKNEERVLVTQILDAVAEYPEDKLMLVLPGPPGLGDEATYLVYRLRVKLYPRMIDVVYRERERWHLVDLDYGKAQGPSPFPDLARALAGAQLAVLVGGLAEWPQGFENATPERAFGFALRRRAR
jgi:hypothetical protein